METSSVDRRRRLIDSGSLHVESTGDWIMNSAQLCTVYICAVLLYTMINVDFSRCIAFSHRGPCVPHLREFLDTVLSGSQRLFRMRYVDLYSTIYRWLFCSVLLFVML